MTALATTGNATADTIIGMDPTPRSAIHAVIRKLDECHARSIPVPKELADAIPLVVAGLMRNDSPRIRAAAAKLCVAAMQHNLRVFEVADKTNRLDSGAATENVQQVLKVEFDARG